MPRSKDPQRAGGKYVVEWKDWQGRSQRQERPTRNQAMSLMRHLRAKGLTPEMRPK